MAGRALPEDPCEGITPMYGPLVAAAAIRLGIAGLVLYLSDVSLSRAKRAARYGRFGPMGQPAELSFGTGIYSFPAAAKLLAKRQPGLQPGTLRYWMKTGLTPASYGKAPSGSDLLSFHDLVSLELVRRFRAKGVSLQRVRKLEAELTRGLRQYEVSLKGSATGMRNHGSPMSASHAWPPHGISANGLRLSLR